jgi:hypothetical protein
MLSYKKNISAQLFNGVLRVQQLWQEWPACGQRGILYTENKNRTQIWINPGKHKKQLMAKTKHWKPKIEQRAIKQKGSTLFILNHSLPCM